MQPEAFLNALGTAGIPYETDVPMSQHTTFRIGGPADVFITIRSKEQLRQVFAAAERCAMPCFLLGKGSNLLISDGGIAGAVVSLAGLDRVTVTGERMVCGAGASLSAVAAAARDAGLAGLAFAYGIPGSIGGAVYMNAGAYGGEMSAVVESVECIDRQGNTVLLTAAELGFGYRKSVLQQRPLAVVETTLRLCPGDRQEIAAAMEELMARRREKQPLEYPSAGSVFKRPEGYFAGTLIEQSGLKGTAVGGAAVSTKHAGFIINTGGATCRDVTALIEQVRRTVQKDSGVLLEPEIRMTGRP